MIKENTYKIGDRTLVRHVSIVNDSETVRWFEFKLDGQIFGDTPTYSKNEITVQEELDEVEIQYELMLIQPMLPPNPII